MDKSDLLKELQASMNNFKREIAFIEALIVIEKEKLDSVTLNELADRALLNKDEFKIINVKVEVAQVKPDDDGDASKELIK